jgi:nicotinamidase-related amidase
MSLLNQTNIPAASKTALIIIDPQNDYLAGGKYPLWNMDQSIKQIKQAMEIATERAMPIYFVQHIAPKDSPFFQEGSEGAKVISELRELALEANVVVKHFADSFEKTELDDRLTAQGIESIVLCGMMTQNCITHTALSKAAEKYELSILSDACTTVDEMVHNIALSALSVRCTFKLTQDL